MTSFHASLAAPADLDAVHALLAGAGERLAAQGYHNWVPAYPPERLAADIAAGAVWVVRDDASLVATYALREAPVRSYDPAPWAHPGAAARYLNRLAVDPALHGRGIGRWCLAHIALTAAADGARAIRCDVLAANAPLRSFYERAGYLARGTRRHSGWEFTIYELSLANDG